MQESIEEFVRSETKRENLDNVKTTAEIIAKKLAVKRNTASHYLNNFVKDGFMIKVNARPVLFLDKQLLEDRYQVPLKDEYSTLKELEEQRSGSAVFDEIIGARTSLSSAVRQLKSAANYPGVGLPVILTGHTGTGKSFLAQKYFDYCVDIGAVEKSGQFVKLNCAEYADNPEILSSILFGYKKGSFTGAATDEKGLFDEADGGVLFLDEVHRLDSKGQEKLFSYLDEQEISPLGENHRSHKVNVRFICATTENLENSFLKTFLRRIPIQIRVPSLFERTRDERKKLAVTFYLQEANKVSSKISVGSNVFDFLLSKSYSSNVGQLKNVITISVANSLARGKAAGYVKINLSDLPNRILEISNREEVRVVKTDSDALIIDPELKLGDFFKDDDLIYDSNVVKFFRDLVEHQNSVSSQGEFIEYSISRVQDLSNQLMYDKQQENEGLPFSFLKEIFSLEISNLQDLYGIKIEGNAAAVLAHYFFAVQSVKIDDLLSDYNDSLYKILDMVQDTNKSLVTIFNSVVSIASQKLNLNVGLQDKIFIWLYLRNINFIGSLYPIKCIVMAHGFSTASSIADAVNQMLGEKVIEAFDMPVDIELSQIAKQLTDYIDTHQVETGLLLLVDMGSLEDIFKYVYNNVEFPIGIINNVSTPMALNVGDMIRKHKTFQEIVKKGKKQSNIQSKVVYPKEAKKKLLITCCLTGIGTANRIKHLLEESIPQSDDLIISSYEYGQIKDEQQLWFLKRTYEIVGIVGTKDPSLKEVPFVPLEGLIAGKNIGKLGKMLRAVVSDPDVQKTNENILRNFSIERVLNSLTILDVQTVMYMVDNFFHEYERSTGTFLTNQEKMALYVHIGCLIERLIRNDPIKVSNLNQKKNVENSKKFKAIQISLEEIEDKYSVKIPRTEISYIYDIIESKFK
ncbi:sigma 54-interacting transcriptional regulator [Ligilactobacillus pobuzihii]|uniref:Transcriptional regulator n=1 Tax=Ligilactobacillus pobuzihii TaxID=449659 RepID=A0A0R2LHL5_9LACO|nr:sigma 54-interacting transcriptional regulator [Ligilactobacillus pobuzihii]KRK09488.1 transcriptional regulator [Ligilactobacillus pobuzihii E100301 = KCTC 13174]KRO01294.1 transcriptional regulator [Ligilactobacillus pobuzihii]